MNFSDSLYILPRTFDQAERPFDQTLDTAALARLPQVQLAQARADSIAAAQAPPPWMSGLEPQPRPDRPAHTSGFLVAVAVMVVLLMFNFRHLARLLSTYTDELVKVRHGRSNVFDEHPAGDTRILIMLIIIGALCSGVLLCAGICHYLTGHETMTARAVASVCALTGAYYIFRLAAYNVTGYTFTTPEGRRLWIRAFNASQALAGVALIIPALLAVFYPASTAIVVTIGAIICLTLRCLFIFKGFSIFYDRFRAILYFILYLCTLEIIPLIIIFNCAWRLTVAFGS